MTISSVPGSRAATCSETFVLCQNGQVNMDMMIVLPGFNWKEERGHCTTRD